MHLLRKVLGSLLLLVLAVFSLQNLGMARIEFLFWSIEAPRALIYVLVFTAGALAGWLVRNRQSSSAKDKPSAYIGHPD
ncbi:MAG TPA: LapA family protein [Mariprofundaceae bacterium]|nr:LapA family protein [Mariprofundaceae bacterium]